MIVKYKLLPANSGTCHDLLQAGGDRIYLEANSREGGTIYRRCKYNHAQEILILVCRTRAFKGIVLES